MDGALKVKNYPLIAGFLFGNLWLLHLVIFGRAPDIGLLKDFSTALPAGVAATVVGVALNELVSGTAKARILFPALELPGRHAFTHLAVNDPRVDMTVLVKRFGTPALPTLPDEQNRLWYRIMKANESKPSVAYAHQYYLLMRDLSFSAILLGASTLGLLTVLQPGASAVLVAAGLLTAELVLTISAGRSLARDLVLNALAEESAKPEKA